MPSSDFRSSKPPDESRTEESILDISKPEEPHLWIELLPLGVQYRIAEYVTEGNSGRDALNLAKTTSQQRHAVSVALEHILVGNFATHAEGLVNDWIEAFEDVEILELWEHPPNFRMLSSPKLREVLLEDEPMQVEALTKTRADLRRVELYARYGTPTYIVTHMLEQITFTELYVEDIRFKFFHDVDIAELVDACDGLEKLEISSSASNQDAIAEFVDKLPSLQRLEVTLDGVEIQFADVMPKNGQCPNVVGLGLYRNKVKWFASFELLPQLKELWLSSQEGWGENEVLMLASIILDLPQLEEMTIKLRPGSERFFPQISSLEKLHVYWNGNVDLSDADELYYKPDEGIVAKMIRGLPFLTNLKLSAIRLTDKEVVEIIKTVGDKIETFGVSMERQDVTTIERLFTIIKACTKYTKRFEDFDLCQMNEVGIPMYDPCDKPVTLERKQEILLHLDHLHRHAPDAFLGYAEMFILDWPEEDVGSQKEQKEKKEKLEKVFDLRRCRRGMNEFGGALHICTLARLLETGCEGLAQDRDAAIELYKQAIWMDGPDLAFLALWELTEDPDDKSMEPKSGGAFELMLALDKAGVKKLALSAEIYLEGSDEGKRKRNPAAAEKLLQFAVDHGYVDMAGVKLGNLLRSGYDNRQPDPYKAFRLYELVIEEYDDPEAMFRIAEMLQYGYGDERPNLVAARDFLERGAKQKWAPCMNDLALLLGEGYEDIPRDWERAMELYKGAVAVGNTVAMSNLAALYVEHSRGDAALTLKAIELFNRSIEEGQNPHAMRYLGYVHEIGYGDVAPNPERAKEMYVQAIEWGNTMAYAYLGTLVERGYGDVAPDPDEAMRLYQLGIDLGDKHARAFALRGYGHLMEHGCAHVKQDLTKAAEFYRRSVDEGDRRSIGLLGDLLEEGGPGFEADPAEAQKLYTRAIEETKNADAMRRLGDLLERGYGDVEADPYKAVELYRRAIAAGDVSSLTFLADTLEEGYGDEPPNPEEAVELYRKAANFGDAEAMCALGALMERGYRSAYPDPLAAIALYEDAIKKYNSGRAMRYLAVTLEEGYLDQPPNPKEALKLYERGAARNDPWSKLNMASLIEEGYENVEPDVERARVLFKEAIVESPLAWHGSTAEAMRRYGRILEKTAGDDTTQLAEAADWYRKSIDKREGQFALHDLAKLTIRGFGDVEPDIPEAVNLLKRAVEYGGRAEPYYLLADLLRKGYDDVKPDPEEADRLDEEGNMILWNTPILNCRELSY